MHGNKGGTARPQRGRSAQAEATLLADVRTLRAKLSEAEAKLDNSRPGVEKARPPAPQAQAVARSGGRAPHSGVASVSSRRGSPGGSGAGTPRDMPCAQRSSGGRSGSISSTRSSTGSYMDDTASSRSAGIVCTRASARAESSGSGRRASSSSSRRSSHSFIGGSTDTVTATATRVPRSVGSERGSTRARDTSQTVEARDETSSCAAPTTPETFVPKSPTRSPFAVDDDVLPPREKGGKSHLPPPKADINPLTLHGVKEGAVKLKGGGGDAASRNNEVSISFDDTIIIQTPKVSSEMPARAPFGKDDDVLPAWESRLGQSDINPLTLSGVKAHAPKTKGSGVEASRKNGASFSFDDTTKLRSPRTSPSSVAARNSSTVFTSCAEDISMGITGSPGRRNENGGSIHRTRKDLLSFRSQRAPPEMVKSPRARANVHAARISQRSLSDTKGRLFGGGTSKFGEQWYGPAPPVQTEFIYFVENE